MTDMEESDPHVSRSVSSRTLSSLLEVWRQSGRQHWIPIAGNSMAPTIRDGDLALVDHDLCGINRGEIIVFSQGNVILAHRVLRITFQDSSMLFTTKGDNVLGFDPVVGQDQLIGRVLMIKDREGRIRYDAANMQSANALLTQQSDLIARVYSRSRTIKRRFLGSYHVAGSMIAMRTVQRAANLLVFASQLVRMRGNATRR